MSYSRRRSWPTSRSAGPAANFDLFGAASAASESALPALAPVNVASIPGASPENAIPVASLTDEQVALLEAKAVIEGALPPMWVRGEVSDFKRHRNGHWYFCLRDASAQVRCVVWSRNQRGIPASPDDGMDVVAFGQLTVPGVRSVFPDFTKPSARACARRLSSTRAVTVCGASRSRRRASGSTATASSRRRASARSRRHRAASGW